MKCKSFIFCALLLERNWIYDMVNIKKNHEET